MDNKHRLALQARLAALPELAGVAVVWQPANPNTPAPLVILRCISDQREAAHSGDTGIRNARIQVDAYADAYAVDDGNAQSIRDSITNDLHGFSGELTGGGPIFDSCFDDGAFDEFDEAAGLVRASRDFVIQYHPFLTQYP